MKYGIAIIGMGCTRFGDFTDQSWSDLAAESVQEAMNDAGIDGSDIDTCWFNARNENAASGIGQRCLIETIQNCRSNIIQLDDGLIDAASAFHRACDAISSGSSDVALVLGAEKQKLSDLRKPPFDEEPVQRNSFSLSPHWIQQFALKANIYFLIHGMSKEEGKKALARITYKNYKNGALNEKISRNGDLSLKDLMSAPIVTWPMGVPDVSQVSNGAAAAIICRANRARDYRKDPVYIRAHQVVSSRGELFLNIHRHGVHLKATRNAAELAYKDACITNPREEINILETHDSCTVAELLTCEDLLISTYGKAIKDIESGFYDLDGKVPSQTDGGLKCWGDPVSASLIRMVYEVYKQLQYKAECKRQVACPVNGLVHHLGGELPMGNASVTILSR